MGNYFKNLFYRIMASYYTSKAYNCRVDAEEAEYQAKAAQDNSAIWLKKLRRAGL